MASKDTSQDDLNLIAKRAEMDMNSDDKKRGIKAGGDSATESGVNETVESRFPGASVQYGSAASGAGNNREIPTEEGGEVNPETGRQTKAGDFEGVGGPEEKMRQREAERPGDQDVQGNVRQGGETRRPNPTGGDVQ